jgi:hypothetical protein
MHVVLVFNVLSKYLNFTTFSGAFQLLLCCNFVSKTNILLNLKQVFVTNFISNFTASMKKISHLATFREIIDILCNRMLCI